MTTRLYYTDSYTHTFTAPILERTTHQNQPALILQQTYFYPTSGGQPHDLGTINEIAVQDVLVRESDQAVVHVLARPSDSGDAATCAINWIRRFDHMQQHTGQHILSQACVRVAQAETVGFHLGESLTIDLNQEKLTPAQLEAIEDLANEVIAQNLTVRTWFPTPDEIRTLALRKTPEVVGQLRVVAIGDFDVTACGGTHVAHTGEVALLKIIKVERAKKQTRLEFVCGGRAVRDYRQKHTALAQLAAEASCHILEVDQAVNKLRQENQTLSKDLKDARERLLEIDAQNLIGALPALTTGVRVVRQVWPEREMNDLRKLATRLTAEPHVVTLLASAGAKANLVFARSADLDHDMKTLLLQTLKMLGSERGGGDARLAQGGGIPLSAAQLSETLQKVENQLSHA